MKLRNKITLAIAASCISASVFASTDLDIRHEWKTQHGDEATRVKLGESYKINKEWKGNISVEAKFGSQDKTDTYKNNKLYDSEIDWGFTYKVNDNWDLKPGMPIYMTPDKTVYKPQLRVVYKTTDMYGIWTALRYRHEFINYADDTKGDTNSKTGEKQSSTQKYKITSTGGFKVESMPDLRLSYEANYVRSLDNVILANDNEWDWDLGVQIGYNLGNFRPYVEAWDQSASKKDNERQFKGRVGIKYFF